VVKNDLKVIFNIAQDITIAKDFEVEYGGEFEIEEYYIN